MRGPSQPGVTRQGGLSHTERCNPKNAADADCARAAPRWPVYCTGMPLTPGSQLGVFTITGPIGVGGMGEVYQATDTNLRR